MRIKKGDTVLITSGKDRGKTGKVFKAFPKEGKVLVEGVNLRKKHRRPRKAGEKGQVITLSAPINSALVKLICSKCGKAARVGYRITSKIKNQKSKIRICKKCGGET